MSKTVLKKIVAVIVFLVVILVMDAIMNQKNTAVTTEMSAASLPVVSIELGNHCVNTMYGYVSKREEIYTRQSLTPVSEDRRLSFVIDSFDRGIAQVDYEVRSADGERLIENGEITNRERKGEQLRFSIQLKDLILENKEYTFVLILTMDDGDKAYYYARFIQNQEFYELPKLDFVRWFHDTIYGGGSGDELRRYLESNTQKESENFQEVTINSSLKQVMWDELLVRKLSEPIILIQEITEQTMGVTLEYTVQRDQGDYQNYYAVREYFRIRYTPERTYLLTYERNTDEYFSPDKRSFLNDRIQLGITAEHFVLEETEGGKILAFINGNRLFSYNTLENQLVQIFSFYDKRNFDLRTINQNFTIKILDMGESGNITFMVAGYINRGIHEGDVGIIIYDYNSAANLVEEQIFLPYAKSADLLINELNNMSYLNKKDHLFLLLGGNFYDIDLYTKEYRIVNSQLTKPVYKVSQSERSIVWVDGNRPYNSSKLVWMRLSDDHREEIAAGSDEYIAPLGFMGEDLVYGLVKKEEVRTDSGGKILMPMYKVIIRGRQGIELKTYSKENIYVSGCEIEGNQITLQRMMKMENGEYLKIEDDQITSNEADEDVVNKIETKIVEVDKKIVQIRLKNQVEAHALKVMIPKEVIFEGGRQVNLEKQGEISEYYVYGPFGIEYVCSDANEAVVHAYEIAGAALNGRGQYIWKKGRTYSRNQIMAVTGEKETAEKSALAVCLDTILKLEGTALLTQPMLDRGDDAYSILQKGLRNHEVLDLTGCGLDAILNFPDQDIPVLALLEEGKAVLIIGFNEQNVVLMDPSTGMVYKKGMNDSRVMFEESGNRFITYLRRGE